MRWWDLGIIIFFNITTALALQMSKIWLTNLYLILKSLIFASIGQLHDNRHLPQHYSSFLSSGLSYFPDGFLYSFDFSHILFEAQQHGVNAPVNLES